MRCASCGEKIEGAPVWRDDEAYCSEECADIASVDEDYKDEEGEYEDDYDGEEEEDI